MRVKEWMTANPVCVAPDSSVAEVSQILKTKGFRRILVTDGKKLLGLITDRDIRSANASKASSLSVYELNYLLDKLKASDIMTKKLYTISAHDSMAQCANSMLLHNISGLPVLENGNLVGIVTTSDILKAFIKQQDQFAEAQQLAKV
ncbi:MAG: CBS domain-containing protein [Trueperaceae bacterium]|nr:CBS domain-containing protein [Trueperaceae bacterium]